MQTGAHSNQSNAGTTQEQNQWKQHILDIVPGLLNLRLLLLQGLQLGNGGFSHLGHLRCLCLHHADQRQHPVTVAVAVAAAAAAAVAAVPVTD